MKFLSRITNRFKQKKPPKKNPSNQMKNKCGFCISELDTQGGLCRKCREKLGINPDMVYDLEHFEELGRCSECKDKNGDLIYEGNTIKTKIGNREEIGKVRFIRGGFVFGEEQYSLYPWCEYGEVVK